MPARNIKTHLRQRGLTLVELVVTIAILAILVTVGIPGFQALVAQNRATTTANDLLASLQFARSAAISNAQDVTVCPGVSSCTSGGQWQGGWIVLGTADDGSAEVLRQHPAPASSVSMSGADEWVFSNTGTLEGQAIVHFDITVSSVAGAARTVCMSLAGNARIIRGSESC